MQLIQAINTTQKLSSKKIGTNKNAEQHQPQCTDFTTNRSAECKQTNKGTTHLISPNRAADSNFLKPQTHEIQINNTA